MFNITLLTEITSSNQPPSCGQLCNSLVLPARLRGLDVSGLSGLFEKFIYVSKFYVERSFSVNAKTGLKTSSVTRSTNKPPTQNRT